MDSRERLRCSPRVSIVTPLVDRRRSAVETAESIRAQEYPDVEHIVIDGGGDAAPLARCPDVKLTSALAPGRAGAVNTGFQLATGDILTVLDAGETLLPGALSQVAQAIDPRDGRHAVTGRCRLVNERGLFVGIEHPPFAGRRRMLEVWNHSTLLSAGVFWTSEVWRTCGPLNGSLDWTACVYDFFCRVSRSYAFTVLAQPLATYRAYPEFEGGWSEQGRHLEGAIATSRRYWGSPLRPTYWQAASSLAWFRLDRVGRARRYLRRARDRWPRGERLDAIAAALVSAVIAPEVAFHIAVYPALREGSRRAWQAALGRVTRFDAVPAETAAYLDRTEPWGDGWVGPRLAVSREAKDHALRVRVSGGADLRYMPNPLVLTVRVNGRAVGRHRVRKAGDFVASIQLPEPLPPGTHAVEVEASAWFVPDWHTRNGDVRPLAWRFGEVALDAAVNG